MASTHTPSTQSTRGIARGISLFLIALLILAGAASLRPAYADNTFLLQLETSDSQQLATEKWEEIKAKNSDVLGKLSMHVAQVALPPDNKVSYRTQVGPLPSRADAETLCNTLQSRGVDCYVVETALYASEAPASPGPESIAEMSPSPQEAKPAPAPQTLSPSAAAPAAAAPAASTQAAAPAPSPEPAAAAESARAPAPAHKAAKRAAPSEEEASHADDPDYIPPPVDSGPVIISASQMPSAVVSTSSPAEIAEATAPAAPAPAAPAPVAPAPAAPAPAAPQSVAESAPAPSQHGLGHYEPGREPRDLGGVSVPAPAPAPVVVATATPVEPPASQEKPGFFSRLFGATPPKPAAAENVVGSVNVAEAVRVPLTTGSDPSRVRVVPVIPQTHPIQGGTPSDSTARAYWAQISYFRDEAQALTFYRDFSTTYPQFTDGVRIRITRPFTATLAANRVSLRVGPFAGTGDVQAMCATATRWRARCTVVRDIGASAAISPATARPLHNSKAPEEATGAYLLQLGTYPSEDDAMSAWEEIKKDRRAILRRLRVSVTSPPASSAAMEVYRLRVGPFKDAEHAGIVCNRLIAAGTDCVVVNNR